MELLALLLFAHASFAQRDCNGLFGILDLLARATFEFALAILAHDFCDFLFTVFHYAAFSSWLWLVACGVLTPKSLQMYLMWKHSLRN